MPFILGVIPARSGSKGVAGKNLMPLMNRPLVLHTIEAAQGSHLMSDWFVSTDGEAIAKVAQEAGASVPFIRPTELAGDLTPTVDAVIHAVAWYENRHQRKVDAIVLLQPTSPLRTGRDIDEAIELFSTSRPQSLVSCYDASHVHPSIMYTMADGRLKPLLDGPSQPIRRQEFKSVYVRNGAIYIASRHLVMDQRKMYDERPAAYVMPRERSINLDEILDFEFAEHLLRMGRA